MCHLVKEISFEQVFGVFGKAVSVSKTVHHITIIIMPMRQMKESSEKHIVIKPQLQNTMNEVQKPPKAAQNGKGPPAQEPQNTKLHNQTSPPSRNRGRRRRRGGRKSDQADVFMRPSSRPCTGEHKAGPGQLTGDVEADIPNGSVENGSNGNSCEVEMGLGFPCSRKSLNFAPRPGFGQLGTKCVVKANHFFAELPNKDLTQYDVSHLSSFLDFH